MIILTNLVKSSEYLLKSNQVSRFLVTNFQLSNFYRSETLIKQGIYASGTIEWE